jgi:hypothetical protein
MEQPREPSGTPEGGQFASTHGSAVPTGTVSTGDFRKGTEENPVTLDKLVSGKGAIGEIHTVAYRVGPVADQNDKPLMEGRGLFFADTVGGAEAYASLHEGYEVTKYAIHAKNAYVTESQHSLYKELNTSGKSYNDAVYDEDRKLMKTTNGRGNSVVAARIVEEKMFRKLRAKGHDAVILTSPPLPAKHELAIIKKSASYRRFRREKN